MEELQVQLDNFKNIPYPQEGHRDDMELELIDADIAGAVNTFLLSKGSLGSTPLKQIQEDVHQLRQWIPEISNNAKHYFEALLKLGENLISEAS